MTGDRRCKILWVSPELMMHMLINPQVRDGKIRCLKVDGLPDGYTIEAVHYSEERHAFGLRLHHSSFDAVPDTDMIPSLTVTLTMEELRVEGATLNGFPAVNADRVASIYPPLVAVGAKAVKFKEFL